jgi:RNA polymerase sigma-70 factor (ECF subfamily)
VTGVVLDERAEAAFAALFAAHYPDLLRYAVRRVGTDAAPDVVAEVFLVAWRRRADVPPDAARVWLYGVAAKVVRNHLRGENRRRQLRSRLAAEFHVPEGDPGADRVRRALGRLRPAEQEVLRLSEWEQLSADEAAAVLRCSPGAFRVRLHRARHHFAAELAALDAEED